MSDLQISTYVEPRWGSRPTGTANIRKDSQARYYLDDVCIAEMRNVDLFTIVTCVDHTTHYVLTAFFKLIDRPATAE